MNGATVYVPSAGRWDRLATVQMLPPRWRLRTALVVPEIEVGDYDGPAARLGVAVGAPQGVAGIAAVRQAIVEWGRASGEEFVIMLDDDLAFHSRTSSGGYTQASPAEVGEALDWMHDTLAGGAAWAGLGNRFMAHTRDDFYQCSNPSMAWGVRLDVLEEHDIRFDDVTVCEDWHVALSILEAGYPTQHTARWVVTGATQNKNGGCASYRNADVVRDSQRMMHKLHPNSVKLYSSDKVIQGCRGVGEAMRIGWKRAYENSTRRG